MELVFEVSFCLFGGFGRFHRLVVVKLSPARRGLEKVQPSEEAVEGIYSLFGQLSTTPLLVVYKMLSLRRLQASIGSLLAMLIPRAEIVPAPAAEVTTDKKLVKTDSLTFPHLGNFPNPPCHSTRNLQDLTFMPFEVLRLLRSYMISEECHSQRERLIRFGVTCRKTRLPQTPCWQRTMSGQGQQMRC